MTNARLILPAFLLLIVAVPATPSALSTPDAAPGSTPGAAAPGAAAEAAAEGSVLVGTAVPVQGSLVLDEVAYGSVQAAPGGSETLSLLHAGQVTRVLVAVGQRVRQGQTLLVVGTEPAALASYRQAVAAVTLARNERARAVQMLEQHLVTRDILAQAERTAADAQTALDLLAQAGSASAEQTVVAGFDGVVSVLPAATGMRVAAQAALVTLDRSARLVAAAGVEPSRRRLVAPGQAARIESLDGGPTVGGHVVSVGAMLDPTTRLVPVLVAPGPFVSGAADLAGAATPGLLPPARVLPDAVASGRPAPGLSQTGPGRAGSARLPASGQDTASEAAGLLPGGAVRVVMQVAEARGWLVPRGSVLTDAQGVHLFQVEAGRAVRREVRVVGNVDDTAAVDGALDPRQSVVTSGSHQLGGGEAVRLAVSDTGSPGAAAKLAP